MNYWDEEKNLEENNFEGTNLGENNYEIAEPERNSYESYNYQPDLGLNNYDNNYSNNGYDNFNSGTPRRSRRSSGRKKTSGFVTKKAFILGLICCMLATSGLTIGGLSLAGAFNKTVYGGATNTISATNYSLASATDNQKSLEEIIAMNENAVVEIMTESVVTDTWMMNYVTQGAGSGVIIDSDGYILTCNHVIEGAKTITVTTKDGNTFDATVIGGDELSDIAVLKIDVSNYPAAQYGNSDELSVGDLAVAIGNPLGKLGGSASAGIISSLDRELEIDGKILNLLQTDASINPGNSGGGLFDGEGNLIGIVVAKSTGSDVEGLGFAIPINDAAKVAKELIENGQVTGRPVIGISVIDATTAAAARQYGYDTPGLYIYEVTGEEAMEAGFRANDIIVAVEDDEVSSRADLSAAINKYSPGDRVTVRVIRDGVEMDIDTILAEAAQ